METLSCEVRIDSTFNNIFLDHPMVTTLRIQQAIIETIEDVTPILNIPSILLTRKDLRGVGEAWVPEDGVICYDNNFLSEVALFSRLPIIGNVLENDLRNATAHELYHMRKISPFKALFGVMPLEEILKNPDRYNPKYHKDEEEFVATIFAFRHLQSRQPKSILDSIGKMIFEFKEGERLLRWRHKRLEFKYGQPNQLSQPSAL